MQHRRDRSRSGGRATEVLVAQLAALAIPPRRTLTSLRRRHGPICVVVIIPHSKPTDVARLLTAGVDGTVDEADLEASLTPTIDAARCGQVVVQPTRRIRGVLGIAASAGAILNLLAPGLTNAEIARRLSVSENTAKSHLSALFTRLGVRSRSEAVTTLNEQMDGIPPPDSEKAANSAAEDLLMNAVIGDE